MSARNPRPAPHTPEMRTFPPRVLQLGEEALEHFCELSGKLLSDGVRADLADQRALKPTLEWARNRPIQGGAA